MPRSAAYHAGLRNGDVVVAVDGELVSNSESGIALLSGAARALSIVVWRERPDPTLDDASAKAAAAMPEAVAESADEVVVSIGDVPWGYYAQDLRQGEFVDPPPNVALYEDLTLAVRR